MRARLTAWNVITLLVIGVSLYCYNVFGRSPASDRQMSYEKWVGHAEEEYFSKAFNRPLLQATIVQVDSSLEGLHGQWRIVADDPDSERGKKSRARFRKLVRVLQLIRDVKLFKPSFEQRVKAAEAGNVHVTISQGNRIIYETVLSESELKANVKLQNLLQLVILYGGTGTQSPDKGVAYAARDSLAREELGKKETGHPNKGS